MFAWSTLQPANVAIPPSTVIVAEVHVNTAPTEEDGRVRSRVTELVLSVVTALPPASCTVTAGCCAKAVWFTVEALGCVENASCAAAPTDIANGLLVAGVGPVVT